MATCNATASERDAWLRQAIDTGLVDHYDVVTELLSSHKRAVIFSADEPALACQQDTWEDSHGTRRVWSGHGWTLSATIIRPDKIEDTIDTTIHIGLTPINWDSLKPPSLSIKDFMADSLFDTAPKSAGISKITAGLLTLGVGESTDDPKVKMKLAEQAAMNRLKEIDLEMARLAKEAELIAKQVVKPDPESDPYTPATPTDEAW